MARRKKQRGYIVLDRLQSATIASALTALIRHVQGQKGATEVVDRGNEALRMVWDAPPLPPLGVEPKA